MCNCNGSSSTGERLRTGVHAAAMASSISSRLRPFVSTTARPTQATQAKQTAAKNRYTAGTPKAPTADRNSWPMAKLQTLWGGGGAWQQRRVRGCV